MVSSWYHLGVILVSCWCHLGIIMVSSWHHLSIILASSWYHLGFILVSFWWGVWSQFNLCIKCTLKFNEAPRKLKVCVCKDPIFPAWSNFGVLTYMLWLFFDVFSKLPQNNAGVLIIDASCSAWAGDHFPSFNLRIGGIWGNLVIFGLLAPGSVGIGLCEEYEIGLGFWVFRLTFGSFYFSHFTSCFCFFPFWRIFRNLKNPMFFQFSKSQNLIFLDYFWMFFGLFWILFWIQKRIHMNPI